MAVLEAGWDLDNELRTERSQTFPGLRVAIGRMAEDAIEVPFGVLYRMLLQLLGLFAIVLHLHLVSARNRPPCGERLPCIVSPQRFREHTK
jgi:hypothetical protein